MVPLKKVYLREMFKERSISDSLSRSKRPLAIRSAEATSRCRKPFSQWKSNFHLQAALLLAIQYRLATSLDRRSNACLSRYKFDFNLKRFDYTCHRHDMVIFTFQIKKFARTDKKTSEDVRNQLCSFSAEVSFKTANTWNKNGSRCSWSCCVPDRFRNAHAVHAIWFAGIITMTS